MRQTPLLIIKSEKMTVAHFPMCQANDLGSIFHIFLLQIRAKGSEGKTKSPEALILVSVGAGGVRETKFMPFA